jgi:hypothetical protein
VAYSEASVNASSFLKPEEGIFMSSELKINCPHCSTSFALTQALAGPMLEAERKSAQAAAIRAVEAERATIAKEARHEADAEHAAQLRERDAAIAERDTKLKNAQQAELAARKAREEAERAKQDVELDVQRRVDVMRSQVASEATRKATEESNAKLAEVRAEIAEKDAQLILAQSAEIEARKAREEVEQTKREIELTVRRRVDAMRDQIASDATRKATEEVNAKLAAAQATIAEKDQRLAIAQAGEIDARRLKSEAEDAKRETELTVARRLDEERAKVREQASRERDEEHRLKLNDKDTQLRVMQEQIEELRRRGEQTSQQLVGEVLEVDLLSTLQAAFPGDRFERTRKGTRGADVLQTVLTASGVECGKILWESKRTKNWIEPWLAKLREDQREVKADVAALATETLPDGVAVFELREQVWVTALSAVVPVATALRRGLIDLAAARRAGTLADTKKDQVFGYLTSPPFRQRISRIVEAYVDMRSELDKEKRSALTQFGKREKQLDKVLGGLTGFYGDLQGIVGSGLPPVDGLGLAAPEEVVEKPLLSIVNSDVGASATGNSDSLL